MNNYSHNKLNINNPETKLIQEIVNKYKDKKEFTPDHLIKEIAIRKLIQQFEVNNKNFVVSLKINNNTIILSQFIKYWKHFHIQKNFLWKTWYKETNKKFLMKKLNNFLLDNYKAIELVNEGNIKNKIILDLLINKWWTTNAETITKKELFLFNKLAKNNWLKEEINNSEIDTKEKEIMRTGNTSIGYLAMKPISFSKRNFLLTQFNKNKK